MIEYNKVYYSSCSPESSKIGVFLKKKGLSSSEIDKITNIAENQYSFHKGRTGGQSDDLPDEIKYKLDKSRNYYEYLKIIDHYKLSLVDHWQFIILKSNE